MNRISTLLSSRKNEGNMASEYGSDSVSQQQHGRVGMTGHVMLPPEPTSNNVYRFTAGRSQVFNAEVLGYDGDVAFRFVTEGKRMAMCDVTNNREVASVLWGSQSRVTWEGVETKLSKFIFKNSGNTGRLFTHDGQLYEWLQDMFHATVRTTPGAIRMAVIYNDKAKPEVELTPDGEAAGKSLLEQLLFLTALFECRLWKNPGLTGTFKLNKTLASAENLSGVGARA